MRSWRSPSLFQTEFPCSLFFARFPCYFLKFSRNLSIVLRSEQTLAIFSDVREMSTKHRRFLWKNAGLEGERLLTDIIANSTPSETYFWAKGRYGSTTKREQTLMTMLHGYEANFSVNQEGQYYRFVNICLIKRLVNICLISVQTVLHWVALLACSHSMHYSARLVKKNANKEHLFV